MRHFLTILFLSCLPAFGATVCVGPSSTGSGSGADYSNLKQWSSGTPARGETWYLVDGTYAGKTINPAQSGTTLFSIKKATIADHGGVSTGWVDTMGDGQATFSGQVWLNTSWLVFDGQSHGATNWSRVATDYGFTSSGLNGCVEVANTSITISNITISGYSAVAVAGDVEKLFVETDNSSKSVHNVTISHCLIDGWQNAYFATSTGGLLMDTWIFEYNICKNGFGSAANHGEWINNNFGLMTNQITRHNWFIGPTSGFTGVIVANNNDNKAPQIYGNIFDGYDSGNGVITGTSGGSISNAKIYNNTFLNCGVAWLGSTAGSGCVAQNNLLYNMDAGGTTGFTTDYNYYKSTTSTPSEAHGQTGSGNPFVDAANGNFALTANSTAGNNLGSPYDTDQYGSSRATWTRGAIEFGDTTPPTLSSATIPSAGNVINFVFSEAVSIGAGGNAGWSFGMSGGAVTATYSSGSGSSTLVYTLSRTVLSGETKSSGLDYTQPGNGIEDASGNDLAALTGASVTNNSSASGGGGATGPSVSLGKSTLGKSSIQ